MVFICAYGTFRRITPIYIWLHQLVLYLGPFEYCIRVSGTFVVENMYIWCFTVGFEYIISCLPRVAYVCRVTTFDRNTIYGISIIMIKYKDAFVPYRGRDRKFTCLFRRRLSQFLRQEFCTHNMIFLMLFFSCSGVLSIYWTSFFIGLVHRKFLNPCSI